jgi:hypothetical protein
MERILRFLVAEISAIEGCEIVKNKVGRNWRDWTIYLGP